MEGWERALPGAREAPGQKPGQRWKTHPHTLLLVLHAVQLIVFITVLILAVLEEGDLLQYRTAQALLAVFASCIPAKTGKQTEGCQFCQMTEPRQGDPPDTAELLQLKEPCSLLASLCHVPLSWDPCIDLRLPTTTLSSNCGDRAWSPPLNVPAPQLAKSDRSWVRRYYCPKLTRAAATLQPPPLTLRLSTDMAMESFAPLHRQHSSFASCLPGEPDPSTKCRQHRQTQTLSLPYRPPPAPHLLSPARIQ